MKANKHEINGYIYVTSDNDIKEGDWFYNKNFTEVHKCIGIDSNKDLLYNRIDRMRLKFAEKIILCNNPNLPIQQLSTEEVEYLKSVDSFEVEKVFKANPKYEEGKQFTENVGFWDYKILIPQETEQPKESIEEYFLDKIKFVLLANNDAQAIRLLEQYLDHAKQTLYTGDDVINAFNEGQALNIRGKLINGKEWFNKHKKQ